LPNHAISWPSAADDHEIAWFVGPVDDAHALRPESAGFRTMPTPPVPPRVTGPLDRAGAVAAGITDWQLRHREVARTSRDTYLPQVAGQLDRVRAVLLGAPQSAIVSHLTAAGLWGFDVPLVGEDPRVHLTVPREARLRQRSDRRIHFSDVPAPETRRRHGVVVTSPSRTWMDLAAVVPPAALLAVTDQMLARGFPEDEFPAILRRATGRRGVAAARRVAARGDRRAGSPMESVLRWLLLEAGVSPPILQHVVRTGGRFVGQVDMAWPDRRVLVEFDGNVHRDRKVFVDDVRRQNGLVLAGWTVLRFTSADVLGRPEQVVRAILAALGLG
jgi:very-short-patch-repair endonuclease